MTQKLKKKLNVGRFYKLHHDVGPIPSGIYRLEEIEDDSWHFSVGKNRAIRFSIAFGAGVELNEISFAQGKRQRTRSRDFCERYYAHLQEARYEGVVEDVDAVPKPITYCFMPDVYEQIFGLTAFSKAKSENVNISH